MIGLIIFDLDGTLIDSAEDITNAINYSIAGTDLQALNVEQAIVLIGEGITRLIEKLLTPELLVRKKEILKRFLDYYTSHLIDNTVSYPFVRETLKKLEDFKKAIISNKRETLSKTILERLGLIDFFDEVLGSDSLSERKPSPLPIKILLDKFSLQPDQAIIVGDSNVDILCGRNAGIKTVGVTYGYRPVVALKEADYLINDIRQLEEIVRKF